MRRPILTKEWVRNRFAIEGAIAEVSRLLLFPNNIDINDVLKIVGKAVSVNRACIMKFRENLAAMNVVAEWCDPHTESVKNEHLCIEISVLPGVIKRLEQGENVMVADVEALSQEAAVEKEALLSQGIRSILIIPIHSTTGTFSGAVIFENSVESREWLGEEVQALRIVAEMISIYWERKRAKADLAVSEKKYRQLYEESRKAEEVYRSLINSSADAIVISDMEGKTSYVSPAFSKQFGWSREEVVGREIPYIPPIEKELSETVIRNVVEHGTSCQGFETKRCTRDGRLLDVSLSVSRYDDHEGKPAGILSILRDTSERRKLEAQLIQAQKMEAIGTLAGGIAHDFNNILQAIFGCTEILLMKKERSHPDYAKLETIEKSAQRASNLTKRLLVFSRKMDSEFRSIGLNNEVDQITRILKRTIPKMIKIELCLESNLRPINADPVQLEQIIMNIAVNARDAMKDGGRLMFTTKNILLDKEFCAVNAGSVPGRYTMLAISDNGHGMNEETISHIFEPFFTTKELGEGTGLGLAMVYGIVKSHGGYITCSSEISRGTTFRIYFPVLEREKEDEVLEEEKTAVEGGSETILFVDDEETNRELGEEILSRYGYTVIKASDGESALESYTARKGTIDLVILDLIMPGIGGRKCLEGIIRMDPQARVIVSSGYSASRSSREARESGAKDFIGKPYDVKRMLKVVRRVLD